LHKHNLNFKIKTMLEMRQNFENRMCSRNTMYKRDMKVWVWNSVMYEASDVKVTLPNAWWGFGDVSAWNYKGFSIIFIVKFLQILASNIAQPKYEALDQSMMQVLLEV
jgi:hypothetical protein